MGINRKIHNVGYRTEQKKPSVYNTPRQTDAISYPIICLEGTSSVLLVDMSVPFLLLAVLKQHCRGHD
jgi:hypothetical protein